MTSEKPRRLWFQFSLRTMFVLVTLAGIASPFVPQAIAWLFPPKAMASPQPAPQPTARPAVNPIDESSVIFITGFHTNEELRKILGKELAKELGFDEESPPKDDGELPTPPPPLNIDEASDFLLNPRFDDRIH